MSFTGRVLVYGGKGALGSQIVSHFKSQNFWVASVDLKENEEADVNCVVTPVDSWTEQETQVLTNVASLVNDSKLDAILCVAGGWAGGSTKSKDFIKNADLMWRQSVWSSAIAAKLANKHLKEAGLLTLPGAKPCLEGTPGMMGYGMAKAAVHQLTKSLSNPEKSGLPPNSVAVAVLPVTLDTLMNRKWMKDADTSTWTNLEFMAELFLKWTTSAGERPESGTLLTVVTEGGHTKLVATGE